MKKEKPVFYYEDELGDDFAGTNINGRAIDESFNYIHHGPIWHFIGFLLYRFVAVPIVWFLETIIMGTKFVNKRALRELRGKPYFIYGNHTSWHDAFIPNLLSMPRACKIIVSPDAVSIPGLRSIVQMFGGVPVPTTFRGLRNFGEAIEKHHKYSNIAIYPEAHIWPYYTGVRHFSDTSFSYPVKLGAPVVAFFTAFSEPTGIFKAFKSANMTVYVSEPMYPNPDLPPHEARRELAERVYNFMKEKSACSTYEACEYVKKEKAVS